MTSRTTYVDSAMDLRDTSIYFYRLSTVDVINWQSVLLTFVSAEARSVDAGIPIPSCLRITLGIGSIVVSWAAVNDPNLIGYLLLRLTDTQAPFTLVTSDTLFTMAQTVYADSTMVPEQVYFYKVQEVTDDPALGIVRIGASAFGDRISTGDDSPPAAPSDFVATLVDGDVGRVVLTWTAGVLLNWHTAAHSSWMRSVMRP